ncbi:Hypothetical_protein [Hexamita inflata]|uniref:Hypothetical_protein n=1 Tax=Hexamita inflata TaxID=28002 RepID=A0AA86V6D7_9EUKA|nr:Hypothetical protein HINF_LOCUS45633 [Hexamita inflata]
MLTATQVALIIQHCNCGVLRCLCAVSCNNSLCVQILLKSTVYAERGRFVCIAINLTLSVQVFGIQIIVIAKIISSSQIQVSLFIQQRLQCQIFAIVQYAIVQLQNNFEKLLFVITISFVSQYIIYHKQIWWLGWIEVLIGTRFLYTRGTEPQIIFNKYYSNAVLAQSTQITTDSWILYFRVSAERYIRTQVSSSSRTNLLVYTRI